MNLIKATTENHTDIKNLYESAFPAEEKKAFFLLLRQQADVDLLVIEEAGKFCGFFSLILYKDIVAIDYFAVSEQMRGAGIGSGALALLRQYFPDRRIMLEIETPDETAPNAAQRVARRAFYERNGFSLIGLRALVKTCDYTLMAYNGAVSMEEYMEIIKIMYERGDVKSFVKEL